MFDVKELERIIKDGTLQKEEVDGRVFLSGNFREIAPVKHFFKTTVLNELSGLVAMIKSEWDPTRRLFVHVETPNKVTTFSYVDGELERQFPYAAECAGSQFKFGQWMDYETFIIALRSSFIETDERNKLIELIASVRSVEDNEIADNGITQSATMKKGSMLGKGEVKAIYDLAPYRTFRDTVQVQSEYLFRISERGGGLLFALFEADGGGWEKDQKAAIEAYLQLALNALDFVTVIS